MPEASGRLWLRQAEADLDTGRLCIDHADTKTYCQAIAKFQQCTEKAVKGVVAALRVARVVQNNPSYDHELVPDLAILKVLPASRNSKDVAGLVSRLISQEARAEIHELCSLTPKKPVGGQLARKNTEYPYQLHNGTWTIPAHSDSFAKAEADQAERVASRTLENAARILAAVERRPK